jgi:putative nucleotidyltransferase with HDIG domain
MVFSGITRDQALEKLRKHLSNQNLVKHSIATEAIMRKVALDRGEDEQLWGLTGLLHDLDYEDTVEDFTRHGIVTTERLADVLPADALHAIGAHNGENNGIARSTDFDHLLAASENLTGLITATALVQPDRKLLNVEPSSVLKKMGKSGFARSVSRECIRECEEAGYSLEEFVALSLAAMKDVSDQLGL